MPIVIRHGAPDLWMGELARAEGEQMRRQQRDQMIAQSAAGFDQAIRGGLERWAYVERRKKAKGILNGPFASPEDQAIAEAEVERYAQTGDPSGLAAFSKARREAAKERREEDRAAARDAREQRESERQDAELDLRRKEDERKAVESKGKRRADYEGRMLERKKFGLERQREQRLADDAILQRQISEANLAQKQQQQATEKERKQIVAMLAAEAGNAGVPLTHLHAAALNDFKKGRIDAGELRRMWPPQLGGGVLPGGGAQGTEGERAAQALLQAGDIGPLVQMSQQTDIIDGVSPTPDALQARAAIHQFIGQAPFGQLKQMGQQLAADPTLAQAASDRALSILEGVYRQLAPDASNLPALLQQAGIEPRDWTQYVLSRKR